MSDKKSVCVYEIISPYDYVYVGITNDLRRRLKTHHQTHVNNVFSKHKKEHNLDFDDFKIRVFKDGLARDEAKRIEIKRMQKYTEESRSLNFIKPKRLNTNFEVEMPNGEIKEI